MKVEVTIMSHCSFNPPAIALLHLQSPSSATDETGPPTGSRTSSRRTGGTPAHSRPAPSSAPTEPPATLSATGKSLFLSLSLIESFQFKTNLPNNPPI